MPLRAMAKVTQAEFVAERLELWKDGIGENKRSKGLKLPNKGESKGDRTKCQFGFCRLVFNSVYARMSAISESRLGV